MANLYKRTDGSLVIADTQPAGTTLVSFNVGAGLAVNAPAYRTLDSSDTLLYHPATYFSATPEAGLSYPLIVIRVYQRTSTAPTLPPSTNVFDTTSGGFTAALDRGWTLYIPDSTVITDKIYSTDVSFTAKSGLMTIASESWSTIVVIGENGTPGLDASIFNIDNAAAVFNKSTAGVITPAAGITLTTSYLNITGTITYKWQKDGVDISGATASTYTVPITDYSSVNTHTYKCIITGTINGVAGATLNDQITIPRLDSGSSSPTTLFSNDNITFTAPTSGYSGISFTNGGCNVTAYIGATQLTYDTSSASLWTSLTFSSPLNSGTYGTSTSLQTWQVGPTRAELLTYYNTYTDKTLYNQLTADTTFKVPTNGYQMFVIPRTGTYRITAWGAPGGDTNKNGTWGAKTQAIFSLTQGDILWITIGQAGSSGNGGSTDLCGSAGGGATLVAKGLPNIYTLTGNTLTPLICAAGGFGAYEGRFSGTSPSVSSGFVSAAGGIWTAFNAGNINGASAGYGGQYSYGGFGGGNGTDDGYGPAGNNTGLSSTDGISYINSAGTSASSINTDTSIAKYTPGKVVLDVVTFDTGNTANTFTCTVSASGVTYPTTPSGSGSTFSVPSPNAVSIEAPYVDVTTIMRDSNGVALTPIVRRITYSLSRAGASGSGTPGASGGGSVRVFKAMTGSTWDSTSPTDTAYGSTKTTYGAGWNLATPTLTLGQTLWQCDGSYGTGSTAITWGTPYLSTLKVGKLSALTVNTGTLTVDTDGYIASGKTSFADTTAGFYLGNDAGTPKFNIGNNTKSVQWNGSDLIVSGNIIGTTNINANAVTKQFHDSITVPTAIPTASSGGNVPTPIWTSNSYNTSGDGVIEYYVYATFYNKHTSTNYRVQYAIEVLNAGNWFHAFGDEYPIVLLDAAAASTNFASGSTGINTAGSCQSVGFSIPAVAFSGNNVIQMRIRAWPNATNTSVYLLSAGFSAIHYKR